jgi:hypothetical protein
VNDATKRAATAVVHAASDVADIAVRRPWVKTLAQFGFYAKGFLFIVIGCLAVAAVMGVRGAGLEDPRGALAIVATTYYGTILLLLFVIGAVGHGIWNILRGLTDVDALGSKWFAIVARVFQVLLGLFYLGLAISSLGLLLSAGVAAGPSQVEETVVSTVLAVPLLGAGLIGLIGLGLVGAGFVECFNGLSGRYQNNYRKWQMKGFHGKFITSVGILSFSARAVLLAVLGYIFLRASFYNGVNEAIGLDAALFTLLDTSHGKWLVSIAGVGLIGHGILAFYEARFRRLC